MHHYAHTFGHAAVRGAGYAAGRQLEHAFAAQFGLPLLLVVVLVALVLGRR